MSCTRSEAALRLIAAYTNRVIDDPDFVGITLADYLAPEIITTVAEQSSAKQRVRRKFDG
jgi:hypothetical protein